MTGVGWRRALVGRRIVGWWDGGGRDSKQDANIFLTAYYTHQSTGLLDCG